MLLLGSYHFVDAIHIYYCSHHYWHLYHCRCRRYHILTTVLIHRQLNSYHLSEYVCLIGEGARPEVGTASGVLLSCEMKLDDLQSKQFL